MLKADNSIICLVGTRITAVSIMDWQYIMPLKYLYEVKHQDVVVWNKML
jgi:hypothetical protein